MVAKTKDLLFSGTLPNKPNETNEDVDADDTTTNIFDDDSDADENISYENPQTGEHAILKRAHSAASGDRPTKSTRIQGGKAAVPKRIIADYDSDDGRIIHLKQQGFSDEYVAQKLVQEGRIRYVPKTVGSRWLRLRKALERAEEERLDDELSDWHVGEDEKLGDSFSVIEKKYQEEIKKLEEKKWRAISDDLALRIGGKKKYTFRACRERHEAALNGDALDPIEIDPDQEGRRVMRETRIAEAKQRRTDEAAEAQRVEDEKKARADAKKAELHEKNVIRIAAQLEKKAAREEQQRLKAERDAEKHRLSAQKSAAQNRLKKQSVWEKAQKAAEQRIFAQYGTKVKVPRSKKAVKSKAGHKRGASSMDDDTNGSDADDEETMIITNDRDIEGGVNEAREEEVEDDFHSMLGDDITDVRDLTPTPQPRHPIQGVITRETLENPRSITTFEELDAVLTHRKMPARKADETHPQVVARICAADEALTTTEQLELLQSYLENKKGNKAVRLQRIAAYEAGGSVAALQGVKSTDPEFKRGYEGYEGEYASLLEG